MWPFKKEEKKTKVVWIRENIEVKLDRAKIKFTSTDGVIELSIRSSVWHQMHGKNRLYYRDCPSTIIGGPYFENPSFRSVRDIWEGEWSSYLDKTQFDVSKDATVYGQKLHCIELVDYEEYTEIKSVIVGFKIVPEGDEE